MALIASPVAAQQKKAYIVVIMGDDVGMRLTIDRKGNCLQGV
jgi:hypothetical protein